MATYLSWAVEHYRARRTCYRRVPYRFWDCYYTESHVKEDPDLIGQLYWEGRILGALDVDFLQFKLILTGDRKYHHKQRQKTRRYYPRHGALFRQKVPTGYGSKKCEESEAEKARKDWREYKQFRRDKARRGGHWRRGGTRKQFAKQHCNRWHRKFEHEACEKMRKNPEAWERWEADIPDMKDVHDSWFWD